MESIVYYVDIDGNTMGPYSLQTLQDTHLLPDMLVLATTGYPRETDTWKPAADYPELVNSLAAIPDEDRSSTPVFDAQTIFYIRRGDMAYGPYTLETLAAEEISEDTLLCIGDALEDWIPAYEISGLLSCLESIRSNVTRPNNVQDIETLLTEQQIRLASIINEAEKPYRKVFDTVNDELNYYVSEYNAKIEQLVDIINNLVAYAISASLPRNQINLLSFHIESVIQKLNTRYRLQFENILNNKNRASIKDSIGTINIGRTIIAFDNPFDHLTLEKIEFLPMLDNKHLFVSYQGRSNRQAAYTFIDTVVGSLYKQNTPRSLSVYVVDVDEMSGLDDSFKRLHSDIYQVNTLSEDIRETFKYLQNRLSAIIRNLLVEPGMTLRSYNTSHDTKEANILLVLKNFPAGISPDNLEILGRIIRNGAKAGIFVILLMDEDEAAVWNNSKNAEHLDLASFKDQAIHFAFNQNQDNLFSPIDAQQEAHYCIGAPHFDLISNDSLQDIIFSINKQCESSAETTTVVPISKYLPDKSNWWAAESSTVLEIPFGIDSNFCTASLKITQKSGQNSAVVIGIPGSGKSVFLHSLICNAAIKYSPEELQMYLIDFSGVEFNSYAIGNLPHARVIAPEAEREFGLSILQELIEEGSRRMELCRRYNVSDITDLKRVEPSIKVPRLLVIIDEFQKLFEENDKRAAEANSKIHTIIQEFRKFAINLILATQRLPSGSLLPKDLIANRIVFESSPMDFSSLISIESKEMPKLRTGECIYNPESGASFANIQVQGFCVLRDDINQILEKIREYQRTVGYKREQLKVFRSGELPAFENRRLEKDHETPVYHPVEIPVYLGESIAISSTDIYITLHKEPDNNILIIGGESDVAQRIAYNCMLSLSTMHDASDPIRFLMIDGLRNENQLKNEIASIFKNLPFDFSMLSMPSEIETELQSIKQEIDVRRIDENHLQTSIYLSVFDLQNIRALDTDTSGRFEKESTASSLLQYIIKNGPTVGVFTIMQVNTLDGLRRVSIASPAAALQNFTYRIALQMPEMHSQKVMNGPEASKLYVPNRPASRYRAYIHDYNRTTSVKFKPYK